MAKPIPNLGVPFPLGPSRGAPWRAAMDPQRGHSKLANEGRLKTGQGTQAEERRLRVFLQPEGADGGKMGRSFAHLGIGSAALEGERRQEG
jgi:hypothetical protein